MVQANQREISGYINSLSGEYNQICPAALVLPTATKILTKMESTNLNEKKLSGISVRFLSEVKRVGVSFYDISKKTGARESMFTKIKNGIQEPSKKFLNVFFECYPEIDKSYILLGEPKVIEQDNGPSSKMNVFSERFLEVLDNLGVKDYYVWNNCGISKSQMSHIMTGKGGASLNIIEEFCNLFPEVNAHYILTGRGSMFLTSDMSKSDSDESEDAIKILADEVERLRKENEELRRQLDKKAKSA